jgi:TusA-related sulfurtransferase
MKEDPVYFLDITKEVCPITFVRTNLLLERMAVGEIVEVRLMGEEPLQNVPRSATEHGHQVLSVEREVENEPLGPHRIRIRKN